MLKKMLTASPKQPHTADLELTKPRGTLYTPYVRGLSERLERICAPLNIRNVFTTANNLKQVLMRVKSQVPEARKKGVVYQVPCKDCDVYTGESKKTLKDWLSTSMQWWEATLTMVLQCMWPRMNTVLTGEMREWWAQWGDIGKGEPPKPSGSDPARTPWTWTMAYTSQLPGTPSWTKLRN